MTNTNQIVISFFYIHSENKWKKQPFLHTQTKFRENHLFYIYISNINRNRIFPRAASQVLGGIPWRRGTEVVVSVVGNLGRNQLEDPAARGPVSAERPHLQHLPEAPLPSSGDSPVQGRCSFRSWLVIVMFYGDVSSWWIRELRVRDFLY